jgi:hypothetical protein
MFHLSEYLKYKICTNIIHISCNTKFVRFSYEPMEIGFYKNLYQLMKLNKFLMSIEEKPKIIKHIYNP